MELALSIIASVLTTVSFIPQAIKAIKGNTKSISLLMYVIFIVGVALWSAYSISIKNIPMILANMIVFVLALLILSSKIKNVKKGEH